MRASKIVTLLAGGLMAVAAAYAEEAPTGAVSSPASAVAMEFAARPYDAVSMALGSTTAFHSAAARVQQDMKMDVSLYAMPWSTKTSKEFDLGADLFFKAGRHFGAGIDFGMGMGQKYEIYTGLGSKSNKTFTPMDMRIGANVAYSIIPQLSLGASVRYLMSKVADKNTLSAIGADVMLAGSVSGFRYAAGVTNLGSKAKDSAGQKWAIPAAGTLAAGYDVTFGKHGIGASLQGDFFFKGGLRAGVGAQYAWNDMVFARVGYSYGGKTVLPSNLSLGAGFKFKGLHLDVTALIGDLTGTVMIGLGYSF